MDLLCFCSVLCLLCLCARLFIYLNAKVSQLLLKCYFLLFEPNILLHDIVINKSNDLPSKQHEHQIGEIYDYRSSTRNVRQPKFEKSQCYTTLHFIRKKVFNHYLFSKAEGQTIQCRLFYAFVNVHYVNVTPSIVDEIGRLSTTEYQ